MNAIPIRVVYIIVVTEAMLAVIGVSALAFTLFVKNYADPAVLSAFISITSGIIGSLGTILVNLRQPQKDTTTITTPSTPEIQPTVTVEK